MVPPERRPGRTWRALNPLLVLLAPQLLGERGARLGLSSPRQFFWVTGALSSFLDNTPTYVALSAAASSLHGTDPQVRRPGFCHRAMTGSSSLLGRFW